MKIVKGAKFRRCLAARFRKTTRPQSKAARMYLASIQTMQTSEFGIRDLSSTEAVLLATDQTRRDGSHAGNMKDVHPSLRVHRGRKCRSAVPRSQVRSSYLLSA